MLTKASNDAANLAHASIFVTHTLFLHIMKPAIDGGVGLGSNIPDSMLAKSRKGKKWVTFDNTKGIVGTKFEVMELVDTETIQII